MLKKTLFSLLILALALGLAGCGADDPWDDVGAQNGTGWPGSNVRSSFGIGGLSAPQGLSNITWDSVHVANAGGYLEIEFSGATESTGSALDTWFTGNGWTGDYSSGTGGWTKQSGSYVYGASYSQSGGTLSINKANQNYGY